MSYFDIYFALTRNVRIKLKYKLSKSLFEDSFTPLTDLQM